jgi:hypothetical protein
MDESEWMWEPTQNRITYSKWYTGNPNDAGSNEHCLALRRAYHFLFSDDVCTGVWNYVCEQ